MTKFIMKILKNLLIAALILFIAFDLIQTPVMTNEVALAQMDTSNAGFTAWSLYRASITIIRLVASTVSGCILTTVALDINEYIDKKIKRSNYYEKL